ncbi:MAG: triose-phosphate isomerase [Rhodospirillaceae bacterium]|nr:triose-phosphate isomerase [Rhodospirillaceae bacterium]
MINTDDPPNDLRVLAMRPLIAGNWKMNTLRADASALAAGLVEQRAAIDPGCDILICPPFVSIRSVGEIVLGSPIKLGAQDCHVEVSGAHTGDVSAEMLVDAGCNFVIVGHSERRTNHGEGDKLVGEKAKAAFIQSLSAIICVGESLDERNEGKTLAVVEEQVSKSVPAEATAENTIVAYEPVWAIGTGLTPTIEQISEVHDNIRSLLNSRFKDGEEFRLLYGGSMNPGNAGEILAIKNVNGGLVGGASLKVEDFWSICTSV